MKAIQYIIILFSMFFSLQTIAQKKEKTVNMDTVTYTMPLHGKHCENIIMKNIPFGKGIKNTQVNLEKQSVTIQYRKDKTDKLTIEKAFEKLGYKAKEIKSLQD